MILEKLAHNGNAARWLLVLATVAFPLAAFSATHTVQFGGSVGFAYSPKSFTANLGDTVKWTGDFSMHPLSSTTIPTGAVAWHNGSGTSPYIYVIKVAGTYDYKCDVHAVMTGSFSVAATGSNGIPQIRPAEKPALQIETDRGNTIIGIPGSQTGIFSLKLYNALGVGLMNFPALQKTPGTLRFSLPKLPKGLYIVRVFTQGEILTKSFSIPE